MGRIYQQTFPDTYTRLAFAKVYDRKNALLAAELLNDRGIPWFKEQDARLLRVLTDRRTKYCGNPEWHEYELYLVVENIDHSKTRARRPQSTGVCERVHQTLQDEFFRLAFRKKLYHDLEELQADLDAFIHWFNTERPHIPNGTGPARHPWRRSRAVATSPRKRNWTWPL